MVVVDTVALAVASCSSFFIDAELACDNRTVTFTNYTLANTIDALFNKFSRTYRSELQCIVVKERRRGRPLACVLGGGTLASMLWW
jgi:hypothetical protein